MNFSSRQGEVYQIQVKSAVRNRLGFVWSIYLKFAVIGVAIRSKSWCVQREKPSQ
ncbi:MAG: hypothetical protein V7L31_02385 [Nostoc sp.]|uniref:hypothetical protein n=1 Tax=Nostoc sp. TaxID=1180 RepID=UPI002FF242A2